MPSFADRRGSRLSSRCLQEDIEAYMKKEGDPGTALDKLQKLYQVFKFIEQRLTQKKNKLKMKKPEIEK